MVGSAAADGPTADGAESTATAGRDHPHHRQGSGRGGQQGRRSSALGLGTTLMLRELVEGEGVGVRMTGLGSDLASGSLSRQRAGRVERRSFRDMTKAAISLKACSLPGRVGQGKSKSDESILLKKKEDDLDGVYEDSIT